MRTPMLTLVCIVALFSLSTVKPQDTKTTKIIQKYLEMPHPEDASFNEARIARMEFLAGLEAMPNDAAGAIGRVLPEVKNPRQRAELIEALGRYSQTKESAALLCELLKDSDENVRRQAIHGLRMMARRTNRTGAKRIIRGMDFAPKVEGLVPYLISAAGDKAEGNRVSALYALADTRVHSAVLELRNRLSDTSERVRFYAACFLTEYQDATGLPEMREALARFRRIEPEDNLDYYWQAEMLFASFERITGKSFGQTPMNPLLSSDTRQIQSTEERYKTLLDTWAQWWAWEPKDEEK